MLAIADTGTGMTPEVKAHLFEPFFTTKPPGKGTGLGLATCFGIVKQKLRHIEVESEPGKGTTFKLYFPRSRTSWADYRWQSRDPGCRGNRNGALVEDETIVRELAAPQLRERGYTVIEAGNGEEGLGIATAASWKIDLVSPTL